ncbi:MAG: phosphate-starvation-inducible PsiE family protein [Proteobacteria bacterium]|nr:phosphate-starvation-inducible PsiE family protein [Pseudomonadota bacterium]
MLKILDKVRKYIAIALLGLMAIIVVSATLEVAYEIAVNMFEPPGFFIGVQDLFGVFGLFLMVLIGLELMTSIQMYLDHNSIHAELMLLVAITAITRKIVILDASQIDPMIMFGIGAIIIALALGYYLVRRSSVEKRATSTE